MVNQPLYDISDESKKCLTCEITLTFIKHVSSREEGIEINTDMYQCPLCSSHHFLYIEDGEEITIKVDLERDQ